MAKVPAPKNTKKVGKTLKEKRAAKNEKQASQKQTHKEWDVK